MREPVILDHAMLGAIVIGVVALSGAVTLRFCFLIYGKIHIKRMQKFRERGQLTPFG